MEIDFVNVTMVTILLIIRNPLLKKDNNCSIIRACTKPGLRKCLFASNATDKKYENLVLFFKACIFLFFLSFFFFLMVIKFVYK